MSPNKAPQSPKLSVGITSVLKETLFGASVAPMKYQLVFWLVASVGFAADLYSKSAVFSRLDQFETVRLIKGFLRLVAVQNAGAAFGIAQGQRWLLVSLSVVALVVVIFVFLFAGVRRELTVVALGLFAGGVSGNLYDRIFNHGLVRDFIDVTYWPGRHWPAFNFADAMLCTAVGLLILSVLKDASRKK